MAAETGDAGRTVDLAHEALIGGWPTLQGWVGERREAEQTRRRLEAQAAGWAEYGRGQRGLFDEAELAEAERWLASPDAADLGYGETLPLLVAASREHIATEREQDLAQARALADEQTRRAEEQAKAAKRLRQRLAWVAGLGILAIAAFLIATYFFNQARNDRDVAQAAVSTAEAEIVARTAAEGSAEANALTANANAATADANANDAATAQVLAQVNADEAATQASLALAQEATAQANAATAQANATAAAQSAATAQAQEATAQVARQEAERESTNAAQSAATAQAQEATAVSAQATAETEAQVALSRQLAAQAEIHADTQLDLALLLGVEANAASNTFEARSVLFNSVRQDPQLKAVGSAHTDSVNSVAFSPDGTLLASGDDDGTIVLWDVATRQVRGEPLIGQGAAVKSVGFSPDGSLLASGCEDGRIVLWDVATQQPIGEPLTAHSDAVFSVAFSPDGTALASGSLDERIILWDVAEQEPLGETLTGHADLVWNVAFSPDGSLLASGSLDGTIIFWNVATRQVLGEPLIGHDLLVSSVAFSPDGRLLASGDGFGTIALWDVATRQVLGEPLTGHTDSVNSVAFSPDGMILASGSNDDTVMLWDLDPASWTARACERANRNLSATEWQRFFGEEPYRETCDDFPPGEGVNDDLTFATPAATPGSPDPVDAGHGILPAAATPVATPEAQTGVRQQTGPTTGRRRRSSRRRVTTAPGRGG